VLRLLSCQSSLLLADVHLGHGLVTFGTNDLLVVCVVLALSFAFLVDDCRCQFACRLAKLAAATLWLSLKLLRRIKRTASQRLSLLFFGALDGLFFSVDLGFALRSRKEILSGFDLEIDLVSGSEVQLLVAAADSHSVMLCCRL
jgi:hypothetical protein